MTPKFKVGDNVNFVLENQISQNASIAAIIENISGNSDRQIYIVKNDTGWEPSNGVISEHNLNINGRYLFMREDQLTIA